MNDFVNVKLKGGAVVMVDFNYAMTKCRKCGKNIRFALTKKNNKYIPIFEIEPGTWQAHFANCEYANDFRKK